MYSEDAAGRSEEMPSALKSITESPAAGGGKVPLLIILHGLTGYKEEPHLAALADMCREIGFASLRPDLYGHGESGGSFREHDLRKWIAEIRELVSWARRCAVFRDLSLRTLSGGSLRSDRCRKRAGYRRRYRARAGVKDLGAGKERNAFRFIFRPGTCAGRGSSLG